MNERSDIGKQLQEARDKRRLSLQDVAHETRIPLATLKSLEENDYSSFASPAYTKSFLNQYSEYLKIDAHEILGNFNTGNVLAQSDGIEYLDQDKSSGSQRATPIRRGPATSSQESSNNLSQPLLILLITGGLLAGGIWGFMAIEKSFNADPEPLVAVTPHPENQSPSTPPPALAPSPSTDQANRPARVISPENPQGITSTPPKVTDDPGSPVYVFPEDTPPPRAIIINEDEDE